MLNFSFRFLLLIYRNTTELCTLILSVASLLNLFLVLTVFIGFLWTRYIKDHALCENRQFYFFLSNLEDLYFFFMPYWYGLESPGVKVVIFVLFLILRGKLLDFTIKYDIQFSSVQFSHSVVSDSLRPHESQHTRPLCPSPTPGVHSDSYPSSQWCHPAISSSVVPFSSCPQSLPALVLDFYTCPSSGWGTSLLFQLFTVFIMKYVEFCQMFYLWILRWSWSLSFILLMWCITLINFQMLNQLCIPEINHTCL